MNVGFVFTNYNNSEYTRGVVGSIALNQGAHESHVVIVDNASAENDVQQLRELQHEYPDIHLCLNRENLGYFKGLNVGIAYLRELVPDLQYMVIGNNDLVFPEGFLNTLESHRAIFDRHAVVSPDLVTLDGVHQNPHVADSISPARELAYDVYYSNYYVALGMQFLAGLTRRFTERSDYRHHLVARPIYQGYGACYILGPMFFAKHNLLWAPTFLMGEELFLSKQLESAGDCVYYEPAIVVHHHDHATLKKLPSKRLWEISRDAHRVYRQYVGRSFRRPPADHRDG